MRQLLLLALCPALAGGALDECSSTRPGGRAARNYRVLRYATTPQLASAPTASEQLAADQLCCVYTRVELVGSSDAPTLVLYSLNERSVEGTSFVAAAEDAMIQICGMSMGSRDCSNGEQCMAAAAAAASNASGPQRSGAAGRGAELRFHWLVAALLYASIAALPAAMATGGRGRKHGLLTAQHVLDHREPALALAVVGAPAHTAR